MPSCKISRQCNDQGCPPNFEEVNTQLREDHILNGDKGAESVASADPQTGMVHGKKNTESSPMCDHSLSPITPTPGKK